MKSTTPFIFFSAAAVAALPTQQDGSKLSEADTKLGVADTKVYISNEGLQEALSQVTPEQRTQWSNLVTENKDLLPEIIEYFKRNAVWVDEKDIASTVPRSLQEESNSATVLNARGEACVIDGNADLEKLQETVDTIKKNVDTVLIFDYLASPFLAVIYLGIAAALIFGLALLTGASVAGLLGLIGCCFSSSSSS